MHNVLKTRTELAFSNYLNFELIKVNEFAYILALCFYIRTDFLY